MRGVMRREDRWLYPTGYRNGMSGTSLLRALRASLGVTQSELGRRAGVPQPSIARVESGRRDLAVGTLDRLARAGECSVALLPTSVPSVATSVIGLTESITVGDEDLAYRIVIQIADDLAAVDPAVRVALSCLRPGRCGDSRFDAFVAGVVEHRLTEVSAPLPNWVSDVPALDEAWVVDPDDVGDALDGTPPALRSRGVVIGEWELMSS